MEEFQLRTSETDCQVPLNDRLSAQTVTLPAVLSL